jgi:hypothetical protein
MLSVETTILFEDPFVVGLQREHPLAKEARVKPQRLWRENLLLLKDGHCLRDHALSACRLADRRLMEAPEATSLPTLVQMVDNELGTTLLPTLAVDAGLLLGTNLVSRPLLTDEPARNIGLVWRRGTGRRGEFRLLAKELAERAKPDRSHGQATRPRSIARRRRHEKAAQANASTGPRRSTLAPRAIRVSDQPAEAQAPEEPFGLAKTIGGLARPMLRGLARLRFTFTLTMAAYDLIRLPRLLGSPA